MPKIDYDEQTGEVFVTYNGRRVSIPGRFKRAEDAEKAGLAYAARYMGWTEPDGNGTPRP